MKIINQNLSDIELIELMGQGDEKAFQVLYNRYWAILYHQVFKILKDDEECKDVVQEVFSSVWLARERISPDTNMGAYLYVLGKNRVFNLISKQKIRQDYFESILVFIDKNRSNTSDLLEEKEILKLVQKEIDNLPQKMREIFELSRKSNLSHKEISTKLGISENTVKKQIYNALKILKPKFNKYGGLIILLFIR